MNKEKNGRFASVHPIWLRVTEDIRTALIEGETPYALQAAVRLIETGKAY